MTEQAERKKLVDEALTWQRTPYHSEARVKGAGCDCGTFILQTFENAGLMPHIDLPHYPIDIACNCANPMYMHKIEEYCTKVDDEAKTGDILMYKFKGSKVPHHAAILVDDEYIIHSHVKTGVTLSNRKGFKKFEVGTYRFNKWI